MGVTKKSVPQRIPVEITKKNTKKKGGELICKNFGVNGNDRFQYFSGFVLLAGQNAERYEFQ